MARPLLPERENLPPNVFYSKSGYYTYRDPRTMSNVGLGKDRAVALERAVQMNAERGIFKKGALPKRFVKVKPFTLRDDLLSEEEIRAIAKPIKQLCGVYLLLSAGEVVYVGQSANCHARIGTHFKERSKIFDSYHIIECTERELEELETQYIGKFVPMYNALMPRVLKAAGIASLACGE